MRKTAALFLIILIFGAILLVSRTKQTTTEPIVQNQADLNNHPIYKTYDFSNAENTIYMGDQPLFAATSSISEFMKRDSILKEELDKLGQNLVTYHFLKGVDINYFLSIGKLDVGIGGDMPTLMAAATDDIVVISLFQEGPLFIVSRDIKEIEKLKGKKIGYAYGSNAHFYLLNTLNKHGVDLKEVELISMDVNEMSQALYQGEIDAFSAWELTPTRALEEHPSFTITHSGKSYGFLYINKDLLENKPEVVHQLLASQIRALKWLRKSDENIRLASEWVSQNISEIDPSKKLLPKHKIEKILKKDLPGILTKEYPRITKDLLSDNGMLKKQFEALKDLGLISGESDWQEIRGKFDTNIIEIVITNYKKYRILELTNIELD